MGISPDLVIATDVVFDGSPYTHFVNVVEQLAKINPSMIIFVIMPTRDRKCAPHFIDLMKNFDHQQIPLGTHFNFKAIEDEKEADLLYPGLSESEFFLHIFR